MNIGSFLADLIRVAENFIVKSSLILLGDNLSESLTDLLVVLVGDLLVHVADVVFWSDWVWEPLTLVSHHARSLMSQMAYGRDCCGRWLGNRDWISLLGLSDSGSLLDNIVRGLLRCHHSRGRESLGGANHIRRLCLNCLHLSLRNIGSWVGLSSRTGYSGGCGGLGLLRQNHSCLLVARRVGRSINCVSWDHIANSLSGSNCSDLMGSDIKQTTWLIVCCGVCCGHLWRLNRVSQDLWVNDSWCWVNIDDGRCGSGVGCWWNVDFGGPIIFCIPSVE